MVTFQFAQLSGFQDVEIFLANFERELRAQPSGTAIFDLSAVDFFPPEVVLFLIGASQVWNRATGQPVQWKIENQDSLCYLERMNLVAEFSNIIIFPPLPTNLWSRTVSSNLMEITAISCETEQNSLADVPQILALAQNLLLGRVTPERMGAACTLLSEVAQNITHSGSDGWALLQIYKAGSGRRVHIAVADIGCGIPVNLQAKYPSLKHPSDYLEKSLEAGVSSRNVGNGLGLYQVQHLVKNGGGTLTIRSATAMLQIYNHRTYKWDNLAYFPGTQVFITIWGRHEQGEWNYLLST